MLTVTIDGKKTQVKPDTTILHAARQVGVDIPTLCHHEALEGYASCRVCIVEVKRGNRTRVVTACNYPVQEDGLEVLTNTERILNDRKVIVQMLLARCWDSPVVREFAARLGITDTPFEKNHGEECILCGLCVNVCRDLIGAAAIGFESRGVERKVGVPFHLASDACIGCGACVYVCPTQCIKMEDLPEKRVIEQWKGEYPLLQCKECGARFGTARQLAFLLDRLSSVKEYLEKCPRCRTRDYTEQLAKYEGSVKQEGVR
jgi:bidirectional [NiFe] hydrogenase diaphorase subunit